MVGQKDIILWLVQPGGAIRFYGVEIVKSLLGLLAEDSNYTWQLEPMGYGWIDVYPKNVQLQNELISLVEESWPWRVWWCTRCWGEQFDYSAPTCRHCPGRKMEVKG